MEETLKSKEDTLIFLNIDIFLNTPICGIRNKER